MFVPKSPGTAVRARRRLGLLLLAALTACDHGAPAPAPLDLRVDASTPLGVLDERYLGFAFDTAQFSGGKWWEPGSDVRTRVALPALESPKLQRLVSQLAPSRMRIGGTDCDAAYVCPNDGGCALPPRYRDPFRDPANRHAGTIRREDMARAAAFAAAVDAEILFCLNFGPGPRDPDTGAWQPDDARTLLQTVAALPHGERFAVWEAGNEANVLNFQFHMPTPLTTGQYAADIGTLRALLDAERPGDRLAAPGSYIHPFVELGEFTPEVVPLAHAALDVVTWHRYATQSLACGGDAITSPHPANAANLFAAEVDEYHERFARSTSAVAAGKPVWNSESASAQCGGEDNLSDTMLDALWMADWIGRMARWGSSAVVRHALIGGNYGLLDPETFDPYPTFLVLALYAKLVAGPVLATTVAAPAAATAPPVYANAFCGRDDRVVLVASRVAAGWAELRLDVGAPAAAAEAWIVTAETGLQGQHATINGKAPAADGTLPLGPGRAVELDGQGRAVLAMPGPAVAFVATTPADPTHGCGLAE